MAVSLVTRGPQTDHSMDSILGLNQGSLNEEVDAFLPPRNVKRRMRTMYTGDQLARMEAVFNENPYPDVELKEELSLQLNLPEDRIQVWFQNRRSRLRRRQNQSADMPSSASSLTTQPLVRRKLKVKPAPIRTQSSINLQSMHTLASPDLPGHPNVPFLLAPLPGPIPSVTGTHLPLHGQLPRISWLTVPSSPIFSPGASPGFSKMFEFPVFHRPQPSEFCLMQPGNGAAERRDF